MNELYQKKTCTEVVETLKHLPSGLPAIYSRMLLQIESGHRRTSSIILRWVTMAFRPLTLQELGAAIGTRSPYDLITIEQAIRDEIALCGPLIKIQEQGVGLVHQSARDYLLRKEPESNLDLEEFRIKPQATHLELARTCFNCVMQSGLQYTRPNPDDGSSSRASPLLNYAMLHWPEHAKCCSMLAGESSLASQNLSSKRILICGRIGGQLTSPTHGGIYLLHHYYILPAIWGSFHGL